ncbi:MAG: V-type ATP synthase subunit I [Treponema sp.]|jgi:V/A-type H+-transporting ATPase subunit I|nr:V-type ATP synthase subunit I [Treponema sp.]
MIVPMKKVSLVVMDKTREASLEKLREVGLVHLEKRSVTSDALSALLDRKAKVESALGLLRPYQGQTQVVAKQELDGAELVNQILALGDERKVLQERLLVTIKEQSRITSWGNFNPASFKELAAQGIVLIPYKLPPKVYASLGKDDSFIRLGADKATVYGLSVGKEIAGEMPFVLPEHSLNELGEIIQEIQRKLQDIEARFVAFARQEDGVHAELEELVQHIAFETARAGMDRVESVPVEFTVSWLTGYVPNDSVGTLKRAAAENGWALALRDPEETDNPPTLVRSNAFTRLIQPLFKLLGTTPGYREYDISLSYLLFFSFFFAMIFGDAGYGSILFVTALILGIKSMKQTGKVPDGILLLGLLSLSTILWGTLTGAWFAMQNIPRFLAGLKVPFLASEQNIKHLCFVVGAGQIVLAHLKNIKKELPSLTALAQLGWLCMVVGLYFLVLNLVLSKTEFPVPSFALYLIGGGLVTFFIFVEQKGGNFLKNVGKGFANFLPTFLNAVSSFSDIISYIRLFAVGLAGAAIASSFNGMAGGLPAGPVRIIAGAFILLFGHGLNLAMNALSVVVHGVRLNLLEYAGHLGMEWSGYAYSPFALKHKARPE